MSFLSPGARNKRDKKKPLREARLQLADVSSIIALAVGTRGIMIRDFWPLYWLFLFAYSIGHDH